MGTTSSDLQTGIVATWNASGLNERFRDYWRAGDLSEFPVLQDAEAGAASPMPFCVWMTEQGTTTSKMSGSSSNGRREIREIPVIFTVQARNREDLGYTAKTIAAELVGFIMSVFGGHPTIPATPIGDLANGGVLQAAYLNDYGVYTGEEEYSWAVRYSFMLDVPVAT